MAKEITAGWQMKIESLKSKLYAMKKNIPVILIIIIAMASFFGFHPLFALFKDPAAQAFASAIFGTVFTIVFTMILLSKQSEVSETSETKKVVFLEQVMLFKSIIKTLEDGFVAGEISKENMCKLDFIIFRLNMLASNETNMVFAELYNEISKKQDDDQNKEGNTSIKMTQENRKKITEFTMRCRMELGLGELKGKVANEQLEKVITETQQIKDEESIIFSGWDEFEKSQISDERKKPYIEIAKAVHDLILKEMNCAKIKPEINYGGGTFSFKVPRDNAKSAKRTFARFGLLSVGQKNCYLESLYKNAEAALPNGAIYFRPSNKEQCAYKFNSIEDFKKNSKSIESAIITSYKFLALREK